MFRRIAALPVAMLAGLALAAPAAAAPTVNVPVITGEPVVGATLLATTTIATEDGTITHQWLRCSASGKAACDAIAGATSTSYVVDVADAGRRIAVRARATDATGASGPNVRSKLIGPVPPLPTPEPTPEPTPQPTPDPEPSPEPSPDPDPEPDPDLPHDPDIPASAPRWDDDGPAQVAGLVSPLGASPLLDPFPVVRIKGALIRDGARMTLFRIRAPFGSAVSLRCTGRACPRHRWSPGIGRIRTLERYLPAGTRIVVRISRTGRVGKYVRIVIRDGKAPARRDACLEPGRTAPSDCPAE